MEMHCCGATLSWDGCNETQIWALGLYWLVSGMQIGQTCNQDYFVTKMERFGSFKTHPVKELKLKMHDLLGDYDVMLIVSQLHFSWQTLRSI